MPSPEDLKVAIDNVLAKSRSRSAAGNILGYLFPKAAEVQKLYHISSDSTIEAHSKRRITSRSASESYFLLAPAEGGWSKLDSQNVLDANELLVGVNEAITSLQTLDVDHQVESASSLIDDIGAKYELAEPRQTDWLEGLARLGSYLASLDAQVHPGMFGLELVSRLRIVATRGLSHYDEEERVAEFLRALSVGADLGFLCDIFRGAAGDVRSDAAKGSKENVFGAHVERIRGELLGRVRSQARDDSLWNSVFFDRLIWFWWGSTTDFEVREYMSSKIDHPNLFYRIIEMLIQRGISSSRGVYFYVNEKSADNVVNITAIKSRAYFLLDSKFTTDDQRAALVRFKKALEEE